LLLSGFTEGRQRILETASFIPLDKQEQAFLGTWSLKDLLAHLIGWDYANIEAINAVTDGKLPAFYEYIDKDWHTYNTRLVGLYKKGTAMDLIKAAQDSQRALIDLLSNIPAKEIFQDKGIRYRGYKVIIARLIEAETKDEKEHLEQVKEFVAKISIKRHIKGEQA